MGKKYIIEIEDGKEGIILCQKGIVTVGLHLENESELKPLGIQSAIPYTEPDLERVKKTAHDDGYSEGYQAGREDLNLIVSNIEQVKEEAYEKGYKTAKCQCNIQAEKDLREVGKRHYQKGLDDLWEAMQKAIKMYCEIDNEVFLRVFHDVKSDWGESVLQALFKNTPQHLIDSIRQYEQGQEIKVGDEVVSEDDIKAVVIDMDDYLLHVLDENGLVQGWPREDVVKTDRHFPDIATVLKKMKEVQK